jgi:hypothetical protein
LSEIDDHGLWERLMETGITDSEFTIRYFYVSNRLIQERFCHEHFGESYAQNCLKVPMFIPNMEGFQRWKNQESVLESITQTEVSVQPTGVWKEFRWYLGHYRK